MEDCCPINILLSFCSPYCNLTKYICKLKNGEQDLNGVSKLLFTLHNLYIHKSNNIFFLLSINLGIVEAYQDLECEVVWRPSFSAPTTGEFDLCVHQGKTLKLKCFAKVRKQSFTTFTICLFKKKVDLIIMILF